MLRLTNSIQGLVSPAKHWLNSKKLVFCLSAMIAVMAGSACFATTYYVSNSGSDSNNGTSTSTPWKTAAKVNGTAFSPGDSILFQEGGIWYEQLSASSNGTSTSPITYGSYGSGAKPIFSGGQILTNANFVPVNGQSNVYTYSDATTVNSVLENQVFLQSGNPDSAPNTWSYSSGVLTISTSSGDDPRTDGKTFIACVRVDEIYTNYHNYLTYTGLDAEDTALINDGYCVRSMGSIGITYNSCDAYYGGKHNFGCINSTLVTYNSCTAAYEMPGQGNGGATLFVSYADTDPGGQNAASSIYNNCVASNSQDTSSSGSYYPAFTCHGAQLGQTTFNNFTTTYGEMAIQQDGGATHEMVNFNGGTINSADFEVFNTGTVVVDGTTFTGNSALDIYGSNNTFQNCKMQDLSFTNGGQTGYNSAIVIRSGANGNIIRFNTIVMASTASSQWPCLTLVASGSHTNWYGNIFLANGSGAMPVCPYYFTPSSSDVNYTDYNFYNANPVFGYSSLSFTTWKSDTGADSHSLTGNPLFVNQTSDNYNLQSTSPAINAAPIPSGWLTGTPPITKDFNGNPRPSGTTYDMGAFEYQSGPAKPVITSPTTASGTVGTAFSYTITASNSPTSYGESGTLPAGLTYNSGTHSITGTPTTAGSKSVTISATNATGTGSATLTITISAAPTTPYNVYAIYTQGTAFTTGGADSYGNAYNSSLIGTSATYDSQTFTYGPANAADAWSNVTVSLPSGTYTKLDMLGTSTGGVVTGQTFTVTYSDNSTQTFTQSLSDWTSPQNFSGETQVSTQASRLNSSGQVETPATYVYGYTFTLNGKTVKSITLPSNRQVIAFGFKGH